MAGTWAEGWLVLEEESRGCSVSKPAVLKGWRGDGTGQLHHFCLVMLRFTRCCCWNNAEVAYKRKPDNTCRRSVWCRHVLETDFHVHDVMQTRLFLAWKAFSWDIKLLRILWPEAFVINYCKHMKDWFFFFFLILEKINQQYKFSSITVSNRRRTPEVLSTFCKYHLWTFI